MYIINPATEELLGDVAEDQEQSIQDKWAILKQGQPAWAAVALPDRIACIARFNQLLEEHRDELARTLSLEMGKPLQQSYNELKGAANRIRFFVEHSEKWLEEEWIRSEGAAREKIGFEPLGIVANISAWNYPYLVGVNVFIPALIGGNAVFYKASEYATLTGMHITRLLYRSGIPETGFQQVIGGGQAGDMLLQLPLQGYFFTGSYRTGKRIAEKVAAKMVPCQLELGGKDPLYVMDDVEDVDKVAEQVLEGVVYNSGQSCCAVERIYVQEKLFDAFVAAYVSAADKLVVGDPLQPGTDLGPLSRREQVRILEDQIRDAVSKGARIVTAERRLPDKGYFIGPTTLVNVNRSMSLMRDESFGPVVGIEAVANDEEAVRKMLDTDYGLTAAVYSRSWPRAEAIMKKMNTGTVYWNCCDRVSPTLPWSGRRHSGLGTTLSYQGIRAFVQPKAWHLNG